MPLQGIDTDGAINHPVVMTECVANPNRARALMSELLFECYGVPAVSYGIDALFSLYAHRARAGATADLGHALVVSVGHGATHVMPVIDGRLDARLCKRIDIGGDNMARYLLELLSLKYPQHRSQLTLSRMHELLRRFGYVAEHYMDSLRGFEHREPGFATRIIDLPYSADDANGSDAAETEVAMRAKQLRRDAQARRMQELGRRRREQQLREDERTLEAWQALEELRGTDAVRVSVPSAGRGRAGSALSAHLGRRAGARRPSMPP